MTLTVHVSSIWEFLGKAALTYLTALLLWAICLMAIMSTDWAGYVISFSVITFIAVLWLIWAT